MQNFSKYGSYVMGVMFCLLTFGCQGSKGNETVAMKLEKHGKVSSEQITWESYQEGQYPEADLEVYCAEPAFYYRSFFSGNQWQKTDSSLAEIVDQHFVMVRSRQLRMNAICKTEKDTGPVLKVLNANGPALDAAVFLGAVNPNAAETK